MKRSTSSASANTAGALAATIGAMDTCPVARTGPTTYSSFLEVDGLLDLQVEGAAHDQLLFVVIHQSHELWFKLLLHELDLAVELIKEGTFRPAIGPLRRVNRIVRSLVTQWEVLDTMTPLGYLAFRGELDSGSGFQSAQFREIEFTAGLPDRDYVASPWLSDDERRRLHARSSRRHCGRSSCMPLLTQVRPSKN